ATLATSSWRRSRRQPQHLGTSPAKARCASGSASERNMRREKTAELPGARRAWMGPPLAALGLMLPRTAAAPSRTAALKPAKAAANAGSRACWPEAPSRHKKADYHWNDAA